MMATELTWIANVPVSVLHACEAVALERPIVHAQLADLLRPGAMALVQRLKAIDLDAELFFRTAIPLAYHEPGERRLVENALRRVAGNQGRDDVLSEMAAALAQCRQVTIKAQPTLLDELALRSGPLREQWEARGPGLLAGIARRTDANLMVDAAMVFIVQPICGGAGHAHLTNNSVRIEAVLANPFADLPEIVRLGWLISTLQGDLPQYNESLRPEHRSLLPALAMIPPTLEAAADVELVGDSPQVLESTLQRWTTLGDQCASYAATLAQWWRIYRDLRPPWPTALVALEQLVVENRAT